MNNKDEELRRIDKIVKLELMIEEYGIKESINILFEAYDNTIVNKSPYYQSGVESNEKS